MAGWRIIVQVGLALLYEIQDQLGGLETRPSCALATFHTCEPRIGCKLSNRAIGGATGQEAEVRGPKLLEEIHPATWLAKGLAKGLRWL